MTRPHNPHRSPGLARALFAASVGSALSMLAACDLTTTPEASSQRPTLSPSVALPIEAGPNDPREALAPWDANSSPWAAFPPGSWVHYRLPSGLEERWWVVSHDDANTLLQVQVRKSAADPWESVILAQYRPRDEWPLVTEMGPAATRTPTEAQSAAGSFTATRVTSERRVVIVADHVPGGILMDGTPDKSAPGGIAIARMLLGYGVAKPG